MSPVKVEAMALSKAIKDALAAWKDGKGEFPNDLDSGMFFTNEGEMLTSFEPRMKKREKAAQEAATAQLLEKLGIESLDELDEKVLAKLKTAGSATTEVEALKKLNGKLAKDVEAGKATIAEHLSKLQGVARRDALLPFAGQVRDVEALSLFVSPHLEVSDDGTVTGKGGKAVKDLVDEVLKTKDYLKNPDFKAGPGTKATAPRIALPFTAVGDQKLTPAQQIMNELSSKGQLPGMPAANGGP